MAPDHGIDVDSMFGVVADDSTGAFDVGVNFHRAGCAVQMFLRAPEGGAWPPADVTVLDTDSRLDEPEEAYRKTHAAFTRIRAAGARRFYKKTCSVLRGNLGAELDATLDATGADCLIFCGVYPLLGRSTRDGIQLLNGKRLEETTFANDPIHPRTTSDIRSIIAAQSQRPAAVLALDCIRSGVEATRERLESLRRDHAFIITDGETPEDLRIVAEAAGCDFQVIAGSAGMAAEWPAFAGIAIGGRSGASRPTADKNGILFVSGSLTPQSREQARRLRETGLLFVEIDTAPALLDSSAHGSEAEQLAEAATRLARGESVLVSTPQDEENLRANREAAARLGLSAQMLGRQIVARVAAVVAAIFERVRPTALVIAGGDTSSAVCNQLGIRGCRFLDEIEPGVPLCADLDSPLLLVLKSGGYGSPDFMIRASKVIRGE